VQELPAEAGAKGLANARQPLKRIDTPMHQPERIHRSPCPEARILPVETVLLATLCRAHIERSRDSLAIAVIDSPFRRKRPLPGTESVLA
jgi:hypothetical protein